MGDVLVHQRAGLLQLGEEPVTMKRFNGSLNTTVSRHPALVVAFISFLIAGFGTVLLTSATVGYNHIMRRFDQIELAETSNQRKHDQFDARLDDHEGRIIRIEAKKD